MYITSFSSKVNSWCHGHYVIELVLCTISSIKTEDMISKEEVLRVCRSNVPQTYVYTPDKITSAVRQRKD
jgi:hypothetical protein